MVVVGPEEMAGDATVFWQKHLAQQWTPDLGEWLRARVEEICLLWRDIGFLNRSRGMWKELSKEIEKRDPTNPWARNYDLLYLEAQVVRLGRVVHAKQNRPTVSLRKLLTHLSERPQILVALVDDGMPPVPEELLTAADPHKDSADLKQLMRNIMAWRDKVIAHTEQTAQLPALEWVELDDAIVAVSEVFRRYALRITGMSYQIEHVGGRWQEWQSVFCQPLFEPKE